MGGRHGLFPCLCAAALILLAPAPLAAQDAASGGTQRESRTAPAATFGAESFMLDNGLQVVLIPNRRAPIVTHMLWYKVGAADEKPGLSGMAHYFEHLMFKGTGEMPPGAYSRNVRMLGGNENAFTGQDYTAYYANVAKENLPKIMEMEADRMQNLAPPPDHFKSEKAVVIEERRQRTENDPQALFGEQMQSTLFPNHPYGTPVIGWMSEIEKYEWQDVKTFYDTWYAPNNAVLIVSGDITAAELKKLAEDHYGPVPSKAVPPRRRPATAPANGTTHMTLRSARVQQPALVKSWIAPAWPRRPNDALALEVLEEIMSGGSATRLYKKLVAEDGKAVNVALSYDDTALDYGTIRVSAVPTAGTTLEELEAAIDAELARLHEDGVSEAETQAAIRRLQDAATLARDSLQGPAYLFGAALSIGASVEDVESWSADIGRVTAEDVAAAARKYLNPDAPWLRPPVTGYLLPPQDAEETP